MALHLLKAFEEGGVCVALFLRGIEGALKVVEHRQQRGDDALGSETGEFFFFAADALPVILEVGGGAKEFVPVLVGLGGSGLEVFQFLRGNRGRHRLGGLGFSSGRGRLRLRVFVFRGHGRISSYNGGEPGFFQVFEPARGFSSA